MLNSIENEISMKDKEKKDVYWIVVKESNYRILKTQVIREI